MIDLYNGDCLEIMDKLIEDGVTVDVIITDPPYGTTACKWDNVIPFDKMWLRLNKLIKHNGAIVLFGSEPFSSLLRVSNLKMYKYDWVWKKNNKSGQMQAKNKPLNGHELISVFTNASMSPNFGLQPCYYPNLKDCFKIKKQHNGETLGERQKGKLRKQLKTGYPNTILEFNIERGLHPTQKPVVLMEYLIKTYTKQNETVLDFTMGSGTTGVACKNTNRNFIGIELDEKYFKIAEERILN